MCGLLKRGLGQGRLNTGVITIEAAGQINSIATMGAVDVVDFEKMRDDSRTVVEPLKYNQLFRK
jgi:hypothetical protein